MPVEPPLSPFLTGSRNEKIQEAGKKEEGKKAREEEAGEEEKKKHQLKAIPGIRRWRRKSV